jgi:hypothetical protein
MEMRDHLLTRIEMLEDDVDRLTQENMDYVKELYCLERSLYHHIDTIVGEVTELNFNEGQESSKEDYQEGKETS